MANHPAIAPGRLAVITGAASGIGRAAAERFLQLGMKVCLVDVNADLLRETRADLVRIAGQDDAVQAIEADVSCRNSLQELKDRLYRQSGEVAILMNNAGQEGGGELFGDAGRWQQLIATNLFGVVNGIQIFVPAMIEQGGPAAVISTGSKQGITCPPGDTAYNVSKAGVKVVTEALAHELRNRQDCQVTAHLLVPGFTFTGFTQVHHATRPAGAWMPEQVIDELITGMGRGDFYIICPDNDVTRALDNERIRWAAEDIIENRPPLSRWHPSYKPAFEQRLAERLGKS